MVPILFELDYVHGVHGVKGDQGVQGWIYVMSSTANTADNASGMNHSTSNEFYLFQLEFV